ncbi:protein of unknown function [Candidatus Nitrosocosmicus franklandus]|uniref:Uncharacterized protein n=1 Tax=Candidatus Nitrosocosmicus franklandianus TaxID=1798806 RepID=A0A484ICT3_9ARCH|nr:protein of unknown function [Candidatus Nitrosocosmicus franklandus]
MFLEKIFEVVRLLRPSKLAIYSEFTFLIFEPCAVLSKTFLFTNNKLMNFIFLFVYF